MAQRTYSNQFKFLFSVKLGIFKQKCFSVKFRRKAVSNYVSGYLHLGFMKFKYTLHNNSLLSTEAKSWHAALLGQIR